MAVQMQRCTLGCRKRVPAAGKLHLCQTPPQGQTPQSSALCMLTSAYVCTVHADKRAAFQEQRTSELHTMMLAHSAARDKLCFCREQADPTMQSAERQHSAPAPPTAVPVSDPTTVPPDTQHRPAPSVSQSPPLPLAQDASRHQPSCAVQQHCLSSPECKRHEGKVSFSCAQQAGAHVGGAPPS